MSSAALLALALVGLARPSTALWLAPAAAPSSGRRITPRCCAFDATLEALLADAEDGSVEAALEARLDQLDVNFIPTLASKLEATPATEPQLPRLQELFTALKDRSEKRFERARDQLQKLLAAGEINKLDAQMCGLIKRDELDPGFFYVLAKNIEDARSSGDETTERLLCHIHTRLQEELEGKADPALALLHKLTRTDDEALRGRILRHYMTPQTEIALPDGGSLPLDDAKPAQVTPGAFAAAVAGAVDKIVALAIDRAVIEATGEDIRKVAKEAHTVVAEAYPPEELRAFQDLLTPVFTKVRPGARAGGGAPAE